MSKPSWEDAPEWATALAMDKGGQWNWYEVAPHKRNTCWSPAGGRMIWAYPRIEVTWDESLEQRP